MSFEGILGLIASEIERIRRSGFGNPEYWLVDIMAQRLEVYREPMEGQYQQITAHQAGTVSAVTLPEVVINLAVIPGDRLTQ
ncbi:MAG: Uma2 family endonuclease [Candidatus Competibacteraceae bacterium]|jgi:Uma2 family endonuclease|nr:Uma2 family endonuclease [Candidatus Competibacteraceae bacterium]